MCKAINNHKYCICVSIFAVVVFIIALNIGLFQYVHPYETTIKQRTFCYKNYREQYYHLAEEIHKSQQYIEGHPFLANQGSQAGYQGLYYDNPDKLKANPRATIGFYSEGNLTEEQIMQIRNDGYHTKLLPSTLALQVYMPWKLPRFMAFVILKAYNPLLRALSSIKYANIYSRTYEFPIIEYTQGGWFIISYSLDESRSSFLLSNYSKA
jgi:hypothetical protein